jgi:hypothetical protein
MTHVVAAVDQPTQLAPVLSAPPAVNPLGAATEDSPDAAGPLPVSVPAANASASATVRVADDRYVDLPLTPPSRPPAGPAVDTDMSDRGSENTSLDLPLRRPRDDDGTASDIVDNARLRQALAQADAALTFRAAARLRGRFGVDARAARSHRAAC